MNLIRIFLQNGNLCTRLSQNGTKELLHTRNVSLLSQTAVHKIAGSSTSQSNRAYQSGTISTQSLPSINHYVVQAPNFTSVMFTRTYAKGKSKGKDKGGKGKGGQKKVTLTSDQLEGVVDMDKVGQEMERIMEDLKEKFIHQVNVRTSQGVFNNIVVKTPDGNFPLIQLGQVMQKSPQLVVINMASAPQYISFVKEAFDNSGLNVNPQQDGTSLFLPIPKVTREHREGLAKNAKMLSEKSKKQMRDVFSKYSKKIKSSKEGHSADDLRAADDMIKDLMHDKVKQVEEMTDLKQKELLGGK